MAMNANGSDLAKVAHNATQNAVYIVEGEKIMQQPLNPIVALYAQRANNPMGEARQSDTVVGDIISHIVQNRFPSMTEACDAIGIPQGAMTLVRVGKLQLLSDAEIGALFAAVGVSNASYIIREYGRDLLMKRAIDALVTVKLFESGTARADDFLYGMGIDYPTLDVAIKSVNNGDPNDVAKRIIKALFNVDVNRAKNAQSAMDFSEDYSFFTGRDTFIFSEAENDEDDLFGEDDD